MKGSCRVVKRFVNSGEFARSSLQYHQGGGGEGGGGMHRMNPKGPGHVGGSKQLRRDHEHGM